jgi:hypothetical protein
MVRRKEDIWFYFIMLPLYQYRGYIVVFLIFQFELEMKASMVVKSNLTSCTLSKRKNVMRLMILGGVLLAAVLMRIIRRSLKKRHRSSLLMPAVLLSADPGPGYYKKDAAPCVTMRGTCTISVLRIHS